MTWELLNITLAVLNVVALAASLVWAWRKYQTRIVAPTFDKPMRFSISLLSDEQVRLNVDFEFTPGKWVNRHYYIGSPEYINTWLSAYQVRDLRDA